MCGTTLASYTERARKGQQRLYVPSKAAASPYTRSWVQFPTQEEREGGRRKKGYGGRRRGEEEMEGRKFQVFPL